MTTGHVRRFIESIIGFVSVKGEINDSFIRLMGAVSKNNLFLMAEELCSSMYLLFILVWIALNTHEIAVKLEVKIRFGCYYEGEVT